MSTPIAPTDAPAQSAASRLADGGRPFTIVVGVDLTDQQSSGYALDQALRMAARIPSSQVHVVHVASEQVDTDRAREAAGLLRLYVGDKAAALGFTGPREAGIHVRCGRAGEAIAQLAADVGADLIVVGTHKALQLRAIFVGSTAEHVLESAPCPVFVAGPKPHRATPHTIAIEPPCPECVQARFASRGASWWCARHAESHHLRRHHVYSYATEIPFAEHDSQVVPTGAD